MNVLILQRCVFVFLCEVSSRKIHRLSTLRAVSYSNMDLVLVLLKDQNWKFSVFIKIIVKKQNQITETETFYVKPVSTNNLRYLTFLPNVYIR